MINKRKNIIKIAIDSPAAAGAGTLAKKISNHYNLFYLDTGKIYRLVALFKIKFPAVSSSKDVKYSFELAPALSIPRGKWIAPRSCVIRIPDILFTDAMPIGSPPSL